MLGDNGTGKTTLLQAIALPLALATKQIQRVTDFDWLGFLPGRYQRWGAPRIELSVLFTDEEITATRALFKRWAATRTERSLIEPGDSKRVRLILDGERCYTATDAQYYQFAGRYYARNLYITEGGTQVLLGWYWERKEIENYLIDPKVFKKALGSNAPPASEYRAALLASAEKIGA
ncbi:hypothetical protein DSM106972_000280 [Dulcicalothrix desertica PCC 7102]|uniref:Uncharacterized protein n=1 Tax=Dulcicalothrix desertica PCC 7102 TaxID=232991 RepID=A0A433VTU7_9CYAN|nr:hypothetical protein DSM106972_000280 [Dulcicalothrix desertica PCC 7102]